MKNKILVLLSALLIFSMLGAGAYAASSKISPGLDVIAYNLELSKTGLVGDEISFTKEDFEQTLGVSSISSITVLTLPDAKSGVLELSGVPVMKNQIISAKNIVNLSFVPSGREEIQACFVVGSVSSSQPLAITCKVNLIDSLNFAPQVSVPSKEGYTVEAIQGISRYSYLQAKDPENDAISFKVVSYPENGTVRMIDRSLGYYCYKAIGSFTGEDSFTYVACDKYGNVSDEITVNINVTPQIISLDYHDMADHPAQYSAMKLAEKGIMIGETLCSKTYFYPEKEVSREEFLVMAMECAGIKPSVAEEKPTFGDADKVSKYFSEYVFYADKNGYISAMIGENSGMLRPDEAISIAEVSTVLYKILECKSVDAQAGATVSGDAPAFAKDSLAAMAQMEILDAQCLAQAGSPLTRAQAALILYNVMEYCG